MIFDAQRWRRHLESAAEHYDRSAPTVAAWIDDLFRLPDDRVTLADVMTALALYEEGAWEHPNFAANRVYKRMSAAGLATTGHAGF